MVTRPVNFQYYTCFLVLLICLNCSAYGDNGEAPRGLGAGYAYLFLLALSPDLAAANYTISDDSDQDLNISTARLPYHVELMKNSASSLQLEIIAAQQKTEEKFLIDSLPGESIDAQWDSYDEESRSIKSTENASMLALKADMIFPAKINIYGENLDLALLLGSNYFFGTNRLALGYTTSYQAGAGAELPIQWGQKKYGYLRFSGQAL